MKVTTITTFETVASTQAFAKIATVQRNHSYALNMYDTRQGEMLTHPNVVGSLNIVERRYNR